MRRRIAIFTGGRADWGLLSVPARLLAERRGLDVVVIASGQHAGPEGTLAAVEADFDGPVVVIDMGLDHDSGTSLSLAMARLHAGLTMEAARLKPDLMLVLGDRYEVLTAVTVASMLSIAVAHIAGGDITEGAMDDAFRHAISKLSHVHFATNADARRRLIAMGEAPERVHVTGSPGIDRLLGETEMTREDFFATVGLAPAVRNAIVTFHPVTRATDGLEQLEAMLAALATFGDGLGLIFTGVNADPGFSAVDARIAAFADGRPNTVRRASLGSRLYANALRHCDVVVGNSSSGLYEAPTFAIPTVNIGDRQQGRLRAASVIDVGADATEIAAAIAHALARPRSAVTNPYGDGLAGERIASIIGGLRDPKSLLRKPFHEGSTS